MKNILTLTVLLLLIFASSCKKNTILSKENLSFSVDTVLFDTVFTTIGSTTKRLKFYNKNTLPILVEEIELMGGSNSPFNINVDGVSGDSFEAVTLKSDDSVFVFVEVTLSVNNGILPLVIEDSIRFKTNGKNQYVKLVVWGQDAYFHVNEIVSDNEPWMNDKPHVIYGIAGVGFPGVDSNLTLTIPAGTEVFGHKNSYLYVYKSTLVINGSYENEVLFKHDRFESYYDDQAGQWGGIILTQSKNSVINYAKIENAAIGLRVDTTGGPQTLLLQNTIIQNSQFYNLFLNAGPIVTVENSVFGDAGIISVYLFAGGEAKFKHCNMVNYWKGSRGGPSFAIKDYFEVENTIYIRPFLNTSFDNCIMYGNVENELVVDTIATSPAPFDVVFRNCLSKREEVYNYTNFTNMIWNQDPLFTDVFTFDFHLMDASPLFGAGNNLTGLTTDITGSARNVSTPTIGAYEN
ncbi:hypothetical protein DNU06_15095 [Putridiphycobacter roseus]|uniref:Right handed beta helix domain-containing protein n=1 Tax=Putridiphycobacter roseus TaxID=2219161 RepID=A0A2W1MZE6_9FLAO|nr:choice-of-anchor Q domain-containing protein [Putridiphycobacter roseus]PZE15971.1 hypothetical protein DNU06_15095 [Putridiphycobacter roseus]